MYIYSASILIPLLNAKTCENDVTRNRVIRTYRNIDRDLTDKKIPFKYFHCFALRTPRCVTAFPANEKYSFYSYEKVSPIDSSSPLCTRIDVALLGVSFLRRS